MSKSSVIDWTSSFSQKVKDRLDTQWDNERQAAKDDDRAEWEEPATKWEQQNGCQVPRRSPFHAAW
jgi:hypothetical protein